MVICYHLIQAEDWIKLALSMMNLKKVKWKKKKMKKVKKEIMSFVKNDLKNPTSSGFISTYAAKLFVKSTTTILST